MPRSVLKDPIKEASALIFGDKMQKVILSEVCKKTGITQPTLCRRRKNPEDMKLREFALIAKVTKRSDEEIVKIIRTMMW